MLKIKKVSDVIGKKVYTDEGDFFGEIEEVNLVANRIESWRMRVTANVANLFSGARGVVIPHNYIKSVGDVFIINHAVMPIQQELPELSEGELAEVA